MKSYHLLLAVCLLSITAGAQQARNIVLGELIVSVIDNDQINSLTKDLRIIDGQLTHLTVDRLLSKRMHAWLLKFDSKLNHEVVLDAVKSHSQTLIAQYNHTGIELQATVPNDPEYVDKSWRHYNSGNYYPDAVADADIDSEEAWDISTGGPTTDGDNVVIAVVDGGKCNDHVDIQMWHNVHEIPDNGIDDDHNGYVDDYEGWNTLQHDDSLLFYGHATSISGIAAAIGNNGIAVTGNNWDAHIMPIQVFTNGQTSQQLESAVIEGYGYVLEQRMKYNETNGDSGTFVVATNSSFSIENEWAKDFPMWCAMYDSLGAAGVLNACAVTNKNMNVDASGAVPSTCTSQHLIAVMASTYQDLMPDGYATIGKGYGPISVDLAAPAGVMTIKGTTGVHREQNATSFATPNVTGAISLLVSGMCPLLLADYKSYPDSILRMMKQWILDGTDAKPAFTNKNATGGRQNMHKMMLAMDAHCTVLSNGVTEYGNVEVKAVFPNPTTDRLNVNIGNQNLRSAELRITSLLGQVIYVERYNEVRRTTNIKLDVSDFTSGYYFVTIRDEMGNEVVQPFVKQ